MIHYKEALLKEGKTFETSEKGNSMTPLIYSGQKHTLAPITWHDCVKGDIVFCKVNGRYYTHLVIAKSDLTGLQIGNNHGKINGWTKNVYGKVISVG